MYMWVMGAEQYSTFTHVHVHLNLQVINKPDP